MPQPPFRPSPRLLAQMRRMYEETNVLAKDIANSFGISRTTLNRTARELDWVRRHPQRCRPRTKQATPDSAAGNSGAVEPTVAAAMLSPAPAAPVAPVDRRALVENVLRAVEKQVSMVDAFLARNADAPDHVHAADRAVRTLAGLARTLNELMRVAPSPSETDDDDCGPDDIEEFRRELAREMDAIIARRKERVPEPPELGQD